MIENLLKLINKKRTMPFYLIHFLTSKCNSNCGHCFNYSRRKNLELTLDQIDTLTRSAGNLYWVLLTGGEPFLRKDIDKIAELWSKNAGARQIKMPTNGSLTDTMYAKTRSMIKKCSDSLITINFSIDGIGPEHDKIRNHPGLFKKLIKSYNKLKTLEKENKNLTLTATITVSNSNQYNLAEIHNFIKNNMGIKNTSIVLTRGFPRKDKEKQVSSQNYDLIRKLIDSDLLKNEGGYYNFLESSFINAKTMSQRNLALKIHSNKKIKRDFYCSAGNLNAVIFENGDVSPCELLPPIANLNEFDYNFRNLWLSKKADNIRRDISKKECICTHECFLNTSVISNLGFYPEILSNYIKIIGNKFLIK